MLFFYVLISNLKSNLINKKLKNLSILLYEIRSIKF